MSSLPTGRKTIVAILTLYLPPLPNLCLGQRNEQLWPPRRHETNLCQRKTFCRLVREIVVSHGVLYARRAAREIRLSLRCPGPSVLFGVS